MPDDLAGQIATWERAASGWEKWREPIWAASAHVGVHLVDAVDPRPGETVLELAAGMGDTGFVAAERVAPGGLVISSDFSPAMVDGARRRAAELGAAGIEFRVLDAQALDLEDASVDAVVCRWGYMLMPDSSAALRETRRVLQPDGRLAFSVWGPPDENPWASIPTRVLADAGRMDPPRPDMPGIFTLSDPARIEALVTAAGFVTPSVVAIRMHWPFDSFDHYWTFVLEKVGAVAAVIERLSSDEQGFVRTSVRDILGARADGGFALAGLCLNASTRVARS